MRSNRMINSTKKVSEISVKRIKIQNKNKKKLKKLVYNFGSQRGSINSNSSPYKPIISPIKALSPIEYLSLKEKRRMESSLRNIKKGMNCNNSNSKSISKREIFDSKNNKQKYLISTSYNKAKSKYGPKFNFSDLKSKSISQNVKNVTSARKDRIFPSPKNGLSFQSLKKNHHDISGSSYVNNSNQGMSHFSSKGKLKKSGNSGFGSQKRQKDLTKKRIDDISKNLQYIKNQMNKI